mmetsp:Transcript_93430/g.146986  ORF Transcript_93430/g.146986 Transcript_93430/m.146986 type:complete len:615 (-) Transcript_93430:231-2075(-)
METPPSIHVRSSSILLTLFCFAAGLIDDNACDSVDVLNTPCVASLDEHVSLIQRRALKGKNVLSAAVEFDATFSDPFDDVPSDLVRDAVRGRYDLQYLVSVRNATKSALAMIDTSRRLKAAQTWDVAAVRSALTSVHCQGTELKRSCAFKNLYFNYNEGGFYVFSLEGARHPDFHSVLLLHKWSKKGAIKQKTFSSLEAFRAFLDEHLPLQHQGLSLIFDSVWHQNIGHAIWDGLYPAFSALCEWGREAESFRSVVGFKEKCHQPFADDGKCMSEGVFRRFGGDELLPYMDLKNEGWQRFDDSIAGSGRKGQRSIGKDYSLPGSRENDRVRKFRDRMYTSHGLELPRGNGLLKADLKPLPSPMQGIIIHNKRFAFPELELLHDIANSSSDTSQVHFRYVDFGAQPYRGSFRRQLELIGKTALHISGPGTAQAYAPFLPDRSIHINLGDRRRLPGEEESLFKGRSVSFMEEVWSEGIPYLRALHYDPYLQAPIGLDKSHLLELIEQGTNLIRLSFPLPVPAGENLSPIARVFVEYCKAIGSECEVLIGLLNGDKRAGFKTRAPDVGWCVENAWAESIVFEMGGWSEQGLQDDGQHVQCKTDHRVLHQIRTRLLGW